eukprot:jgi/Botrbrau1/651/Bobra.0161s0039.1
MNSRAAGQNSVVQQGGPQEEMNDWAYDTTFQQGCPQEEVYDWAYDTRLPARRSLRGHGRLGLRHRLPARRSPNDMDDVTCVFLMEGMAEIG